MRKILYPNYSILNEGSLSFSADPTYIDDIIEGVFRTIEIKPQNEPTYQIMNIGNGSPVNLLKFIETLENGLGKKAEKHFLPMQPGDVKRTWADISKMENITGYKPQTTIEVGVLKFAEWFKSLKW